MIILKKTRLNNNKRVINASEPVNNSDLVTKKYHDDNYEGQNSLDKKTTLL